MDYIIAHCKLIFTVAYGRSFDDDGQRVMFLFDCIESCRGVVC